MPSFKKPNNESKFDIQILAVYQEAETLIIKAINKIVGDNGSFEDDIVPILSDLQTNVNRWAEYRVSEEYLRGTRFAERNSLDPVLQSLQRLRISDAQSNLNTYIAQLSQAHIDEIVESVNEAIAINSDTMSTFASNLETTLVKPEQEIKNILSLGSDITEVQKKQSLVKVLNNRGVPFLTDRSGRERTFERYSETVVRTETAKAFNQGTINRGVELGITKFIRDENIDCCPDICEERRGEIRDAEVSRQPPYLLLHPNCQGTREPVFDE